jgi:DNA-binding transcriptional LysR family regulator
MELRDIEYFAVIAEHKHLGRAADALRLSQPALSKSLKRLEDALQTKLMKCTAKGVELTPEGAVLLQRSLDLHLSLQSISREITELSGGRVGHVRVGIGFPAPARLMSELLAAFLQEAPRTKVSVTVSDNDLMLPELRTGGLDLILNYLPMEWPIEGLSAEKLWDDENVVCVSKTHRLAKAEDVTFADLSKERWATSDPGLGSQRKLRDEFRKHGLPPPNIALESRSATLRLQTIVRSDLLDFTSRKFVEQSEFGKSIAIIPVRHLSWQRPVGFIHRNEVYLPPALKRVIKIVSTLGAASDR